MNMQVIKSPVGRAFRAQLRPAPARPRKIGAVATANWAQF